MGHARALLALEGAQQSETAVLIAQKSMTVRDTERLVQRLLNPPQEKPEKKPDPEQQQLSQSLSSKLGVSVQFVRSGKENGKVILNYQNAEEWEKICHFLNLK